MSDTIDSMKYPMRVALRPPIELGDLRPPIELEDLRPPIEIGDMREGVKR